MIRKTANYLIVLLVSFTIATQLTGCKKHNLQKVIADLNDQCPVSLGLIGDVNRVWLDGKTVVFETMVNNNLLKVNKLKQIPDVVKESALLGLVDGNSAYALVKENVDLKYIYTDPDTKEKLDVLITHDELSLALAEKTTKSEQFLQRRVDNMFTVTKLQLPMYLDEVTVLDDFFREGNNAVYLYTVDGDNISLDVFEEALPTIKQNIISTFRSGDPSVKSLLTLLAKAKMGIIYRYQLVGTDIVKEFSFTQDEVTGMANV